MPLLHWRRLEQFQILEQRQRGVWILGYHMEELLTWDLVNLRFHILKNSYCINIDFKGARIGTTPSWQTEAVVVGPAGLQDPKQDGFQKENGYSDCFQVEVKISGKIFVWLFVRGTKREHCQVLRSIETWNLGLSSTSWVLLLLQFGGGCKDMIVLLDICLGIFVRSSRFFSDELISPSSGG